MSEKSLWMLIVLAAAALLGVLAWRRGLFARVFPAPNLGHPQPFAGGLGPKEYGPSSPGGGSSTFGKVCNTAYQVTGTALQSSPDPRAQAAGVVAKVGGPAICAAEEWAAGKVWDGSKYVAKGTASSVKAAGSAVAGGAKSAYKNTLGRLFG